VDANKKLSLVVTDRDNGDVERIPGGDEQAARLKRLGKTLGMKRDTLRIRLLMTLDPHAPPLVSSGFLYRYEA
jgi:hypothetical protein